jgi:hypothetical protein
MSVRDAETKDLNTPPVATSRLGAPLALTAIERRAVLVRLRADETFTDLKKRLH